MPVVNYLAVIIAAVAATALGMLWYAPFVFGRRGSSRDDEDESADPPRRGWSGWIATILIALVLNLLAAYLLGVAMPKDPITFTVPVSAVIGLVWVAGSMAITYRHARRRPALMYIDGGFHVLRFALLGLVLALLH